MKGTTVWFGPPGTGKTTTLVGLVRDAINKGTPPHRIAYLAFTRSAAQEARRRIVQELEIDPDDLPWFRTLHSTAARQLGIRSGDLMEPHDWEVLGRALEMELVEPDDDAGRWAPPGGGWKRQRGRMVQAVHSKRRALGQTMELGPMAREIGRVPATLVDLYHRTLRRYKADRAVLDYGDLIEMAPGDLPVDMAVIDEAQDLTPAQWAFALRAVSQAESLHIAGDDDQAVYEWAGANVSSFLRLVRRADRVHVLQTSYRLPAAIHRTAVRISERIGERWRKEWGSRPDAGQIQTASAPEHLDMSSDTWLLTARTRRGLARWEAVCKAAGIRYRAGDRDSVRPEEVLLIRAWETARAGRGHEVDQELVREAIALTNYAPDKHPELLPWRPQDWPVWHEAMVKIPPARRRYYEACLRRSRKALTEQPRVLITTIHGSKGLEADQSAVLTDLPAPAAQALVRPGPEADAEHRVWYVAATRARQALTLITPEWDEGYDLGVYSSTRIR